MDSAHTSPTLSGHTFPSSGAGDLSTQRCDGSGNDGSGMPGRALHVTTRSLPCSEGGRAGKGYGVEERGVSYTA